MSHPQIWTCECGAQQWAGFAPCHSCGAESPEYRAETERINLARAEAGLPPLDDIAFAPARKASS